MKMRKEMGTEMLLSRMMRKLYTYIYVYKEAVITVKTVLIRINPVSLNIMIHDNDRRSATPHA